VGRRREDRIISELKHAFGDIAKARKADSEGKLDDEDSYGTPLRNAGRRMMEALEWAFRDHLRKTLRQHKSRGRKSPKGLFEVIALMEEHGKPPLPKHDADLLRAYATILRNPTTHDGRTPPLIEVERARLDIARIIACYFPQVKRSIDLQGTHDESGDLARLKEAYFEQLREELRYFEVRGMSRHASTIQLSMDDLFIPLRVEPASRLTVDSVKRRVRSLVTDEAMDFRQALEDNFIVLLGEPGSGKSTLCRYIAYAIAVGSDDKVKRHLKDYVPIMLSVNELAIESNNSKVSALYSYVTSTPFSRYGRLFEHYVRQGRALLLFDGLDEAQDAKRARSVWTLIEKFQKQFGSLGNKIVITSREGYYEADLLPQHARIYRVCRLDLTDVGTYLFNFRRCLADDAATHGRSHTEAWLGDEDGKDEQAEGGADVFVEDRHVFDEFPEDEDLDDDEREHEGDHEETTEPWEHDPVISQLLEQIESNEHLLDLVTNPLNLVLVAPLLLPEEESDLVTSRGELLDSIIETFVEKRPQFQGRCITLSAECLLVVLEALAHEMLELGLTSMSRLRLADFLSSSRLMKLTRPYCNDAQPNATEIERNLWHTGLLVESTRRGKKETRVRFWHKILAEYLAARYVARKWLQTRRASARRRIISQYAHKPKWHEVLYMAADYLARQERAYGDEFVETISALDTPWDSEIHRNLFLASEIASQRLRLSQSTIESMVSELAHVCLKNPHVPVWLTSISCLKRLKEAFSSIEVPESLKRMPGDSEDLRFRKAIAHLVVEQPDEVDLGILHKVFYDGEIAGRSELIAFIGSALFRSKTASHRSGTFIRFPRGHPDPETLLYIIDPEATTIELFEIPEDYADALTNYGIAAYFDPLKTELPVPCSHGRFCLLVRSKEIKEMGTEGLCKLLIEGDAIPRAVALTASCYYELDYDSVLSALIELANEEVEAKVSPRAIRSLRDALVVMEELDVTALSWEEHRAEFLRLADQIVKRPRLNTFRLLMGKIFSYIDGEISLSYGLGPDGIADPEFVEWWKLSKQKLDALLWHEDDLVRAVTLFELFSKYHKGWADLFGEIMPVHWGNAWPFLGHDGFPHTQHVASKLVLTDTYQSWSREDFTKVSDCLTSVSVDAGLLPKTDDWFEKICLLVGLAPAETDIDLLAEKVKAFLAAQVSKGIHLLDLCGDRLLLSSELRSDSKMKQNAKRLASHLMKDHEDMNLKTAGLIILAMADVNRGRTNPWVHLLRHPDDRVKVAAMKSLPQNRLYDKRIAELVHKTLRGNSNYMRSKAVTRLLQSWEDITDDLWDRIENTLTTGRARSEFYRQISKALLSKYSPRDAVSYCLETWVTITGEDEEEAEDLWALDIWRAWGRW